MKTEDLRTGYNAHRLIDGDPYAQKEIDFITVFNEEWKHSPNMVAQLVNHPKHKNYLDENEEKIVLTVIQWLGTPVGQGFLERVNKKANP